MSNKSIKNLQSEFSLKLYAHTTLFYIHWYQLCKVHEGFRSRAPLWLTFSVDLSVWGKEWNVNQWKQLLDEWPLTYLTKLSLLGQIESSVRSNTPLLWPNYQPCWEHIWRESRKSLSKKRDIEREERDWDRESKRERKRKKERESKRNNQTFSGILIDNSIL